jgi:cation:H+ antiporter
MNLPSSFLIFVFLLSTTIIWVTGVRITKAVDKITTHFNLGEAFGGVVFLAIVTNLPEIAITIVASFRHDYDIAISNLLGGIAIQTVVLVLIDVYGVGRKAALTYKGHSKVLVVEGAALILILAIVLSGHLFPNNLVLFKGTIFEWAILFVWLYSIYYTSKIFKTQLSHCKHIHRSNKLPTLPFKGTIQAAIVTLVIGGVLTLFAGWSLALSGEILSARWGISGIVFGATILAFCTALPEISTGIASAKIRDYEMSVSDIFGGNAFLPVLFLMATMIGGDALLPNLKSSDVYLTIIGIVLTAIYMIGMVVHSKKQIFSMGYDSFIVLIVYLLSIWGLMYLISN